MALDLNIGSNAPLLPPGTAAKIAALQGGIAAMQPPTPAMMPVLTSPVSLNSAMSTEAAMQPRVAPSQTVGDQQHLNMLKQTGSGIDQIGNPLVRGIARGADIAGQIAGSVFSPIRAAELAIPGTTLHHNMLVNQSTQRVAQDQAQDQGEAALQNTQAQEYQRQQKGNLDIQQGELDLAKARRADRQSQLAPQPAKAEDLKQEHADAVMSAIEEGRDPSVDPKVQAIENSMSRILPEHAVKPAGKDDQFIAIQQKIAQKIPLTPEETAFLPAYHAYVKANKLDPAAVRVQAIMQMPQAVVDPNDPSRTIFTTKRGAIGKEAPTSGDATAARATIGDFTHGTDSRTLNAGQTLTHHTNLYDQAVDAVHNGNTQVLNRIGNELGVQMGSNAQTNLNLIRQGVAMEAARFYTGGVPGEHEIDQFNKSLSGDGSPSQMHGGAATVRSMAAGKMKSLQDQYNAGRQGQANFGSGAQGTAPAAATHVFNPATGKIEAVK